MTDDNQNDGDGGSSDEDPATLAPAHHLTSPDTATAGRGQGIEAGVAAAISEALRNTVAGAAASRIAAGALSDALAKHHPAPKFDPGSLVTKNRSAAKHLLSDEMLKSLAPQNLLGKEVLKNMAPVRGLSPTLAGRQSDLLPNANANANAEAMRRHIHSQMAAVTAHRQEVVERVTAHRQEVLERVTAHRQEMVERVTAHHQATMKQMAERRQLVIDNMKSTATFRSSMAHMLNMDVPRVDLSAYTSVMSGVASAQAAVQQNLANLTRDVGAFSSIGADLRAATIRDFASTVRDLHSVRAGLARSIVSPVNAMGLMHTNVMSAAEDFRTALGPVVSVAEMVRGLAPAVSMAEMVRGLAPAVSIAETLRDAVAPTLSSMISELMRGWNVLSGLGHQLANWALLQARRVRRELLRNPDRNVVRAAVAWFMKEVLHYKWIQGDDHIDAAIAALLDDSWLPRNVSTWPQESDTREQLRQLTNQQHRLWRPIGETQLQYRSVGSLDAPLKVSGSDDSDGPYTEADRVRAVDFAPAQIPVSDPRLQRMFEHLTPVEQEIVLAKYGEGCTWAEAAVSCGRLPGDGERLRRKFLRLRNIERQTAQA